MSQSVTWNGAQMFQVQKKKKFAVFFRVLGAALAALLRFLGEPRWDTGRRYFHETIFDVFSAHGKYFHIKEIV